MTVSELIATLTEYDGDSDVQIVIYHKLLFRLFLSLDHVEPVIDTDMNTARPCLSLLPHHENEWYNIIRRNELELRQKAGFAPVTDLNICLDGKLTQEMEEVLEDIGLDMATAYNIFAKKVVKEKRIPFDI